MKISAFLLFPPKNEFLLIRFPHFCKKINQFKSTFLIFQIELFSNVSYSNTEKRFLFNTDQRNLLSSKLIGLSDYMRLIANWVNQMRVCRSLGFYHLISCMQDDEKVKNFESYVIAFMKSTKSPQENGASWASCVSCKHLNILYDITLKIKKSC